MSNREYGSTDSSIEENLIKPSPVSMDNSTWDSVESNNNNKQGNGNVGEAHSLLPMQLRYNSQYSTDTTNEKPQKKFNCLSSSSSSTANTTSTRLPITCIMISICIVTITTLTYIVPNSSWMHWNNDHDMNDNNGNNDDDDHHHSFVIPSNVDPRRRMPFSLLDPVHDLGLHNYFRPLSSSPYSSLTGNKNLQKEEKTNKEVYQWIFFDNSNKKSSTTTSSSRRGVYPTNSWYQNMLMLNDEEEPAWNHRAYSIPYIVDASGPIPGLRIHMSQTGASSNVVQMNLVQEYGMTIGVSSSGFSELDNSNEFSLDKGQDPINAMSHRYVVEETTELGITMKWEEFKMKTTVTKGMPYATMIYETIHGNISNDTSGTDVVPTVFAELSLAKNPIIDGGTSTTGSAIEMTCSDGTNAKPFLVKQEIELFFESSDFTWFVFVSEPVFVQCLIYNTTTTESGPGSINTATRIQIVDYATEPNTSRDLVVRVALSKLCTSGRDPIYCHQEKMHPTALFLGQGNYDMQLRTHAHLFPGSQSKFDFDYSNDETAILQFDWNVQNFRTIALHPVPENEILNYTLSAELITYALPHHFDMIVEAPPTDVNIYCVNVLIGPACLYEGSNWNLIQDIPDISFTAPRPPGAWAISDLANSLNVDMDYTLPSYIEQGIGDTYFSGKMLAKFSRILLIADELIRLCQTTPPSTEYIDVCTNVTLPNTTTLLTSVNRLKASVEVWINGSGAVPFVYDSAWGGVASCGCVFNSTTNTCVNTYPNCVGFDDPGLNFGNAFYNDMHFHYGYHIYAAATVAYFDPAWGRQLWEQVLLLIRCIANPSTTDTFFPTYRHKDWYQGHSWASGIAAVFPNGKNQESSSEAIAAYEAVALYGKVMSDAWKDYSVVKASIAKEITKVGKIMTASEIRSAQYYWHVKTDTKIKIYPSVYSQHAIGILWQTMAQFQTWFGARPYLASGIQLLPLTPISEARDSLTWAKQLYDDFATSCEADITCETYGWSVLQLALLAKVGHPKIAVKRALDLNVTVFDTAGGNGHSLTNTIWFLSTRRQVDEPLPLTKEEKDKAMAQQGNGTKPNNNKKKTHVTNYCGQPELCTNYVLDTIAGLYTCRQRMNWLIQEKLYTEEQACYKIAVEENPKECGHCNPESSPSKEILPPRCSPCTMEQCSGHLNRCPIFPKTYVCTEGSSYGGCADTPWDIPSAQCTSCCDLTQCQPISASEERAKLEKNCPPCAREICRGSINSCSKEYGTQYLCIAGPSRTGCSMLPWAIDRGQCEKCCALLPGCEL